MKIFLLLFHLLRLLGVGPQNKRRLTAIGDDDLALAFDAGADFRKRRAQFADGGGAHGV